MTTQLDSLTRFQVAKRKEKERARTDRLIDRQFRLKGKRHMLNVSLKYCRDVDCARILTDIRNATDNAIREVRREILQRLQDGE